MKIFRLFAAAVLCLIMAISGCSLPETDEESGAVIIREAAVTTIQSTKPAETAPKTTAQTSSEKPVTLPATPSTTAQTTTQTTTAKPAHKIRGNRHHLCLKHQHEEIPLCELFLR